MRFRWWEGEDGGGGGGVGESRFTENKTVNSRFTD